jgi:hypothetical protein
VPSPTADVALGEAVLVQTQVRRADIGALTPAELKSGQALAFGCPAEDQVPQKVW